MRKNILAILALGTVMSSCTTTQITPSDNFTTFGVAADNIHGIISSAAVKVVYNQAPETKVTVEAPDNVTQYLVVKIKDGILQASIDGFNVSFENGPHVTVTVTSPTIDMVNATSASRVDIPGGLETSSLSLDVSSAASIDINGLKTEKLNVSASSAGSITVSGSASVGEFVASSAGAIDAADLIVTTADAVASSAGRINCCAKNLESTESSSGNVKNSYK